MKSLALSLSESKFQRERFLSRPLYGFAPWLVIPALLLPPVPPKLIGGFGLSFTGFSPAEVPVVFFLADRDVAEPFALWCSRLCNSLELAPAAVAGLAVAPMGALFFGAFAGAERFALFALTVLFCCAKPLTLIPTKTTPTANENLIFKILNSLFGNFECSGTSSQVSGTHLSLDARALPKTTDIPPMLNPPPPESTREKRKKANGR